MKIGLKRDVVFLERHDPSWSQVAEVTIQKLSSILGDVAVDIQHVGSTAIKDIYAKPIIDIAVGVKNFSAILSKNAALENSDIIFRGSDVDGQLLYVIGDVTNDVRTHHIHVVIHNSTAWHNYINFRDYLNFDKTKAQEYSELKRSLSQKYPDNRAQYTREKQALISEILQSAQEWRSQNHTSLHSKNHPT